MLRNERKPWPKDCLWPEPIWRGEGEYWDLDLAEMQELDEEGQELLEIKEYMDELVASERLNEDYSLNEDYEDDEEAGEDGEDTEKWQPEKGADYWDDGFDIETWEEDLSHHINELKITACAPETDPVSFIRQVTGYSFINENILRQAFTRRSFGAEYGLGDCEALEFYGDSILNTVVTKELYRRFSDPHTCIVENPFQSLFTEGDLSKMRSIFISRDRLAARAAELGLDKYILYGVEEESNDTAREDMMEALIGAIAADSDWDWSELADVVDRLVMLQLDTPSELVKRSKFEELNAWHQKHFGRTPEYEVYRNRRENGMERYDCTLRYMVPENDKEIRAQRIDAAAAPTRSSAREYVAEKAISFLMNNGLWMSLADAHIAPTLEDSINQLQELFQKKYVDEPEYNFEERKDAWYCTCFCGGVKGFGFAEGKTKAKKKAAFMVLVLLMRSAGLSSDEMEKAMLATLSE